MEVLKVIKLINKTTGLPLSILFLMSGGGGGIPLPQVSITLSDLPKKIHLSAHLFIKLSHEDQI